MFKTNFSYIVSNCNDPNTFVKHVDFTFLAKCTREEEKRFACGGSLEPLSENPPPPLRAPVTGTIPKPPKCPPTVVAFTSGHFRPHPMAQRKMEDVAPHLGIPLAQTTRM